MTSEENVLVQLVQLLQEGRLARSRCSGAVRRLIAPLLETGVVVDQRAGAGRQLAVQDPETLRQFIESRFPNAVIPSSAPSRIAGVARFRNSKTYASDTPEIVCVRAWREEALCKTGQPTGAALATAQHGAFSFVIRAESEYTLNGLCAVVENPIVFLDFERLGLAASLVIYSQGRLSRLVVSWLAAMTSTSFSLLHLPDYDPVGISEFARLRQELGDRVRLHAPGDLAERFVRFSNPRLLERPNSLAVLANLRTNASPQIQAVLELIHRHNAGLEQEALLI
jgi:hypothetical protein